MRLLFRLLLGGLIAACFNTAAFAAWHQAKSRHFIIYADLDPAELKRYAERLERFDQAVRSVRGMDDPPLTDSQRLTIFALKDEQAVGKLVGSPSILGFYVSNASGNYAFVPRKPGFATQRAEITAESVFFHEYAHHLQLADTSAALPAWVVEGFAEFFGSADIQEDGSVRIGSPPLDRQWSVQRYDGFPIGEMLGGTLRGMTGRDVASLYGRGWLLTHMLTFDPARRGQMKRYLDGIQSGVDPLQSAKAAFGDDLRNVNRDLDEYLRQRTFKTFVVDGQKLTTGQVALRTLRAGEAAAMDLAMRLRAGVDRKEAARAAAEARKLAAAYPAEPVVHLVHGEAELEAKNYAAAEAAGRRAATADPKLSAALIVVGKARLELGRQNPAATDWKEVRSWFLRANKLDPEDAEPLFHFYRTYAAAKTQPTDNAVSGLLYAVNLAPRDELLKIEATHQMATDNRLDEARKLFAPVAFYPHSAPEWRETKGQIMQALKDSDRGTALQLLAAEIEKRKSDEDD